MKAKLALASAAALVATGAQAQFLGLKSDGDWAGPYVGIHGGYGIDVDKPVTNAGVTANNNFAITNNIRPSTLKVARAGVLGGGQAGFNLQSGNIIYGVEGDFSYTYQRGGETYRSPFTVVGGGGVFPVGRRLYVRNNLQWMGTARARVGYQLGDGMIYATGGYAFGRIKGYATFNGDTDAQTNYYGSHNYVAQGWTAGGGLEFKPFAGREGALSKISVRAEALYYDLGKSRIYALQTGAPAGYYVLGLETRGVNGRVGLNYHF